MTTAQRWLAGIAALLAVVVLAVPIATAEAAPRPTTVSEQGLRWNVKTSSVTIKFPALRQQVGKTSTSASVICVAHVDQPAEYGNYLDAGFSTKCDGGRAWVEAVGNIQYWTGDQWATAPSYTTGPYGNPEGLNGWRTNSWVGTHARAYDIYGCHKYRLRLTGRASLNGSTGWVFLPEYISPTAWANC